MNRTGKIVIFIIGFLLSYNHMPIYAAGDERLPDVTKVLVAYGCIENGQFRYGAPVVTKARLLDENDILTIEGMKSSLDTPEEFITVSYVAGLKVVQEVQGIIEEELPQGKTGALRLTSMWLKKQAEHTENSANYQKVVSIIKNIYGLKDDEIQDCFSKAIENEVLRNAKDCLGKWYSVSQLKENICKPIIEYYINPIQANRDKLVKTGMSLMNEDMHKGQGYIEVLIKLNDRLASNIINKIHEARLKK
jgi:hypothetical protein